MCTCVWSWVISRKWKKKKNVIYTFQRLDIIHPFFIISGLAIECFDCASNTNPACADPFNITTGNVSVKVCEPRHNLCAKFISTDNAIKDGVSYASEYQATSITINQYRLPLIDIDHNRPVSINTYRYQNILSITSDLVPVLIITYWYRNMLPIKRDLYQLSLINIHYHLSIQEYVTDHNRPASIITYQYQTINQYWLPLIDTKICNRSHSTCIDYHLSISDNQPVSIDIYRYQNML